MFRIATSRRASTTPVMTEAISANIKVAAGVGDGATEEIKDGGVVEGDRSESNAIPALAKETDNVLAVDGRLTYSNITYPRASQNDDDLSLLTTGSQESIDLSLLPNGEQATRLDNALKQGLLSFHASQIESMDLNNMEFTAIENITEAAEEPVPEETSPQESASKSLDGHNLNVLVNVGKQLLLHQQETEDKETKPNPNPKMSGCFKILAATLVMVVIIGIGMSSPNNPVEIIQPNIDQQVQVTTEPSALHGEIVLFQHAHDNVTIDAEEEPAIFVGEYAAHEQEGSHERAVTLFQHAHHDVTIDAEEEPAIFVGEYAAHELEGSHEPAVTLFSRSSLCSINASWAMLLVTLVALFPLAKFSQAKKGSCKQPTEDVTMAEENTVKTEGASTEDWDLSKYEKLKVVELRELLRSRKCNTVGKKPVLVRRISGVYRAELETLTVRQLRPILRSKGCKQAGKKPEIIRKLVEAGI
jgi:hypothetical protein